MSSRVVAYYNEIDPYAAQWLRNLIAAGHIAPGVVDERSVLDVGPDDLAGFTQCHFFAGIGVWSYALRLAGWADDRPVWTGSCPCQPFSVAGAGLGFDDPRHVWQYWFHLIEQCRPGVVFGEQVEAAIRHGWLDLVQDDMEGIDYAFAAVGLPAAGVGAPHIRQRLFFVADADFRGRTAQPVSQGDDDEHHAEPCGEPVRVVHAVRGGCEAGDEGRAADGCTAPALGAAVRSCADSSCPTDGFWRDVDGLCCRDGKWRPVESGSVPLVDGAAARVGRLRAYGNAICAPLAAGFVKAFMECRP